RRRTPPPGSASNSPSRYQLVQQCGRRNSRRILRDLRRCLALMVVTPDGPSTPRSTSIPPDCKWCNLDAEEIVEGRREIVSGDSGAVVGRHKPVHDEGLLTEFETPAGPRGGT